MIRMASTALQRRLESFAGGSSVKQRLAGGTFWTLTGNICWRVLSAISTITIARILGPKSFGEFGMVRSTVQMFSIYAAFRLGNTAAKYVAEFKKDNPAKAARILKLTLMVSVFLCGIVSLILLFTSRILAIGLLKNETMHLAIATGSFMLFFTIYGNIRESVMVGFENFKAIAITNITKGVLTPVLCIPLTYFMGVQGAILGLSLVAAIVMHQLHRYIKEEVRLAGFPNIVRTQDIWKETSVFWQFALPGFISGVITSMILWAGRIILTRQEAGYAELGLFTAADQWRTMVLFIPAILARVVLPLISSSINNSDSEVRESISMQAQASCMIALPLTVLIIGFTEPLAALFGKQFVGTEQIIPMLIFSVFFSALNQSVRVIYDGIGRRWLNLFMWVTWGFVFLTASLYFIPKNGAFGFALAHLLGEMVLFVLQASYVDLVLVRSSLRRHLPLFLFSVVLLSTTYGSAEYLPHLPAVFVSIILFGFACIPIVTKLKRQFS
jgi:O-antigen/teichoic acid export membrane protein